MEPTEWGMGAVVFIVLSGVGWAIRFVITQIWKPAADKKADREDREAESRIEMNGRLASSIEVMTSTNQRIEKHLELHTAELNAVRRDVENIKRRLGDSGEYNQPGT